MRADLNPAWDARFEFAVADPAGARVGVYVWSRSGGLLPDRFLGRVVVRLADLPDKAPSPTPTLTRPTPPTRSRAHSNNTARRQQERTSAQRSPRPAQPRAIADYPPARARHPPCPALRFARGRAVARRAQACAPVFGAGGRAARGG